MAHVSEKPPPPDECGGCGEAVSKEDLRASEAETRLLWTPGCLHLHHRSCLLQRVVLLGSELRDGEPTSVMARPRSATSCSCGPSPLPSVW